MTVTTMLPELALRSPEADWDRALIAGFFAGAPDTTL